MVDRFKTEKGAFWPKPETPRSLAIPEKETLSWRLRNDPNSITARDMMDAAEYIEAYNAIVTGGVAFGNDNIPQFRKYVIAEQARIEKAGEKPAPWRYRNLNDYVDARVEEFLNGSGFSQEGSLE